VVPIISPDSGVKRNPCAYFVNLQDENQQKNMKKTQNFAFGGLITAKYHFCRAVFGVSIVNFDSEGLFHVNPSPQITEKTCV
jgi:hypothetical protein